MMAVVNSFRSKRK